MAEQAQAAEPTGLTLDQATNAIEGILTKQASSGAVGKPGKGDKQPPPAEGAEEPQEEEDPSTGSGSTDSGQQVTEEEVEGADEDNAAVEGDEAPESEEEEPKAEAQSEEQMVEWELDGQTVQMPVSEVTNGYMRQRDYTQKTQALAEQVRAFEQHVQAVQQERQRYAQLLPALEEGLARLNPQEPNWQQLMATDVGQYWEQRARWDEFQRQRNAIAQEKANIVQLQQMDFAERLRGHLDRSRQVLTDTIPGWRDEKRQQADKDALRAFALKSGFSEEEINQAYDPRLVRWGVMAMKYAELLANKPKPKPKEAPAVLRPGVKPQGSTKQARIVTAKRRLAQTGSVKDGIAALELMLS